LVQAPETGDGARPGRIADRIVDAILARKLAPGQRLGEQQLADLFGCSRTLVREALARLAARGMVEVNARRGWFVVQPTPEHAREAFAAREVIETGLLQSLPAQGLKPAAIKRLKQHVAQERAAIARTDSGADAGERSWLLGDFHVCLAECAGNSLLAEILKDLTARTTLIATLYQSTHEARQSCREHAQIVAALEAGDHEAAVDHMRAHLRSVTEHLGADAVQGDPLAQLREALTPVGEARAMPAAKTRRLFTPLLNPKDA
jgi:DNA-binding GntR family transcriptional regulator